MRHDPNMPGGPVLHAEFDSAGQRLTSSEGFLSDGQVGLPAYLAQFDLIGGVPVTDDLIEQTARRWMRPGEAIDARTPFGRFRMLCSHETASGGVTLVSIENTTQHARDALARKVMDRHPMPIYVNEARTGQVLYRNSSARKLFEVEHLSDTEGNMLDLFQDQEQNRHIWKELRTHGQLENYIVRTKSMKGREFWLNGAASLFHHDGTEVILTIVQDVSTLRAHDREVAASRDLLNDALRALNEGFALFDEDGRLIVCNDRYREINSGVSEFITNGVHWETLLSESARRSIPIHAVGRTQAWVAENMQIGDEFGEYRVERTDGRVIAVKVHPTSLGGFIVSESDITARTVAEKSAEVSEQMLSTVLKASPANLCMSRLSNGEVIYASPACFDLFGNLDSVHEQFVSTKDRADFLTDLLPTGRIDDFSADARGQDGEAFPALFSARIIRYRDEDVMVSTATDLTDQVAAERTIQDANQRLSDAIEALSEGFILYDADERVVRANKRFLEMNAPYADWIKPGTHTRDLLKAAVETRHFVGAEGWLEDYEEELARGDGGSQRAFEFQMTDGTWINSIRRPTKEGGFVITWLDVTERTNAQAELERANARLQDAIDSLDEGFALFDADCRLVKFNDHYKEFNAHIAPVVTEGASYDDIMSAAIKSGWLDKRSEALARETITEGEWRTSQRREYTYKDDKTYLVSRNPTSEGGFVVTRIDVTEQKMAAAELARLNDRLRDAIEALDEGFALYDQDDRLVMWNRRYEELNPDILHVIKEGVAYQEILETAINTHKLPPDEVEKVRASGQRDSGNHRRRFEFEHKDGRSYSVSRNPTSEDGFVVTRLDITERKNAERAQREADGLVRNVLEACPVNLIMCRFDNGTIEFVSSHSEEKFGRRSNIAEYLVDMQDGVRLQEDLDPQGSSDLRTLRIKDVNDVAVPVALSSRLIDLKGVPMVVTHAYDLTERIEMEGELSRQRDMLHQSEKLSALGELLAGVAHELNNPLSVVVGHALMLQEELTEPELLKRTNKISAAAERCSRIVKTFLAMARQRPAKLESTSIATVIDTALEVASYGLRSNGAQITAEIDTDLPPVMADADQLTQVFANLIVNAEHVLAPMGADARLRIEARTTPERKDVTIEVTDNGPGIPEPIRARIFEPFFTTKTVGEGTGIGLAFCHRIIDTHNGQINVTEAPGGGARFTINLAAVAVEAVTDTVEVAPPTGRGRVLVVDDEEDVAELITQILSSDGFEVTTVHSAEDALALLPGGFDMILSDMNMPGMGGKTFLAAVKDSWPELAEKFGFITGDTMSPDAAQFLDIAGRPYLEKPIAPVDLRRLAANILAGA